MPDREKLAQLQRQHYCHLGVIWSCNLTNPNDLFFANFRRLSYSQKGNGAVALQELLKLADLDRFSVTLDADNSELVFYYANFGFAKVNEPFSSCRHARMRRYPHTATISA